MEILRLSFQLISWYMRVTLLSRCRPMPVRVWFVWLSQFVYNCCRFRMYDDWQDRSFPSQGTFISTLFKTDDRLLIIRKGGVMAVFERYGFESC